MSIKKTITIVLKGETQRDIDQMLEQATERLKSGYAESSWITGNGAYTFETKEG